MNAVTFDTAVDTAPVDAVRSVTRPARTGPSPRQLAAAEADLEWWHGPRVAELGESAQSYESGGGHVHDQEAAWRLHERMTSWRRQVALRRARAVGGRLGGLGRGDRATAAALYAPRGYRLAVDDRQDDHGWSEREAQVRQAERVLCFRFALARPAGPLVLLGLVLGREVFRAAYARGNGGKSPETPARAIAWVFEATRQSAPKWVREAIEDAKGARTELLTRYAETKPS